jgi:hypothetical protein
VESEDRDAARRHGTDSAREIAPREEAAQAEQDRMRLLAMRRRQVQRKATRRAEAGAQIPSSGGTRLPTDVRTRMEPQLGADLSQVNVYASGASASAAETLGARAFTVGADVHFAAGQFAPGTKEGDRLLAHELTHVVQGQRSGVQRKADPGAHDEQPEEHVSQPGEPAEVEADAVADKVTDGLHGGHAEPAGGGGAQHKAPPIAAKLAGVGRKIFRKTAKEDAEALEARDGGHSLGRHGPDVSDDKLTERITTGVAPDGKFSPTDTSTKFASHEVYLETRTKAAVTLDGAITKAKTKLGALITALAKAEDEHKKAPPGPDKGPKGKFGKAVADAKKAITDACAPTAGELPVKAAVNDPTVRVKLATSYEVVVDHGKSIGSGFQGAGGTKTVTDPSDPAKTGQGHNSTTAIPMVTRSRTTFSSGAPALMTAPLAETMKAAQHFPTTEPAGIS